MHSLVGAYCSERHSWPSQCAHWKNTPGSRRISADFCLSWVFLRLIACFAPKKILLASHEYRSKSRNTPASIEINKFSRISSIHRAYTKSWDVCGGMQEFRK